MIPSITLIDLFKILKWDSGTMADAQAEVLRRAELHDELVEALDQIMQCVQITEGFEFPQYQYLLKKAKGEQ